MSKLVLTLLRLTLFCVAVLVPSVLSGCASEEAGGATYVSISVQPATLAVDVGASKQLEATAVDTRGKTHDVTKHVAWSSSDESVASVSSSGLVKGLANGSATIVAKLGKLTDTADLTVGPKIAVFLQLSPSTATIALKTTQKFVASAVYGDGTSEDVSSRATWTSAAPSIASVDANGVATAVAPGGATISAKYQDKTATAALTVSAAAITSVTLTPADVSIPTGTTQQFKATATLADQSTQNVTNDATWTSSDSAVATVDTAGLATGVAPGATTITARLGSVTGSTSMTVTGAVLQGIQVSLTNPPDLPVGATFAFSATGTYSDKSIKDITSIAIWASSDPTAASISNDAGTKGVVTGLAGGSTQITASAFGLTSPAVTLKVSSGVTLSYITLSQTSATLSVGQTVQLAATGHYSDSTAFDLTHNVKWASVRPDNDTAVSNFSVNDGLVTALASTAALPGGNARVKASQGSVNVYAPVTVKDTAVTAVNVDCEPAGALACIPAAYNFPVKCKATATFSDATTGDVTGSANWTASDAKVAVFDSVVGGFAVFTVIGEGPAAILATQAGKTSPGTGDANAAVRGIAATPLKLDVAPPEASLPKGAQQQFSASAKFSSSVAGCASVDIDVTDLSYWSTSNASVATASNASGSHGLVEGVSVGTVQVQVAFDGIIGFGHAIVQQACLESVSIEQVDPTYPDDVMVSLSVKGTYSDKSTLQLEPGAGLAFSTESGGVDANWNLDTSLLPASATLTVAASSQAGTCAGAVKTGTTKVSVDSAAKLSGLSIQPASTTIPTGATAKFQATAAFAGYTSLFNVSKFAKWGAAQPVAGLAHAAFADFMSEQYSAGTTAGTTTVTAAYESSTASAMLTISGATVKSVTISELSVGSDSGLLGQVFPLGLQLEFQAKVEFSDGSAAINPAGIVFSSDDPSKLKFDSGKSLARTLAPSEGINPNVKASYAGVVSDAVPIAIDSEALSKLSFSPDPVSMPVNSQRAIEVRGTWAGEVTYHFDLSRVVSCTSGNSALVSVSSGVTGTHISSYGTATGTTAVPLTCLKDGMAGTLAVRVNDACVSTVSISPAAPTMPKGTTVDFVATASYSDGSSANITDVGSWTASDSSVLGDLGPTTAKARRFKGLTGGAASVAFSWTSTYACAGGVVGQQTVGGNATVNVSAAEIASVVVQPSPVAPAVERRLPLGETVQLHAYATLTDGSSLDVTADPGTTWSSQMPARASVSKTGMLSGVGVGKTIIEVVTSNGKTSSLLVDVQNCGAPIVNVLAHGSGNLPIGTSRDYTAGALYQADANCTADSSERSFAVTDKTQWISSDTTVAAVATGGANAGKATALAAGTAKIKGTYRGVSSNAVDVKVVAVSLSWLQVQPAAAINTFVGTGSAVKLQVVATYSDGTNDYVLDPPSITWLVVDPSVVSITAGNVLTGLKLGSTTIRAQFGAIVSDPVTVTVSSACITGVSIVNPASDVTLPAGVPLDLAVKCATSDGSSLPCNPSYAVVSGGAALDYDAATFPTSGKLRVVPGATSGTALLRATVQGCTAPLSDDLTVTVGSAKLTTLKIAPNFATIARGTKHPFGVTAWYSGGSGQGTYDVTRVASFVSSNTLVATPDGDGSGNVTALMFDGNTLITASYLGVYSNAASLFVQGKVLTSISISPGPSCTGALGSGLGAAYPSGGFALRLQAIGHFSDDTSDPLTGATWSLGTPNVAGTSIDPTAGVLTTGSAGGTQLVKVSRDNVTGSMSLGIVASPIASISVSGPTSVPKGVRTPFTATVTLVGTSAMCSGNTYAATTNVTWASSDLTKGTLIPNGASAGLFEALTLGATNVTASRGSATGGPVVVTITNATKQSVRCAPTGIALSVGGVGAMRAVVAYSDGSEVDESMTQAQWNASIAAGSGKVEFSANHPAGFVTGLATGIATVSPFVDGGTLPVTASCQINVN